MGLYLDTGNDLFRKTLNSKIYVDKSMLISYMNDVLDTRNSYVCVSRPRRFGKSMAAEMLAAYYDKSCNSMPLFEKLMIAKEPGFKENLNKYDVIFWNMTQVISSAGDTSEILSYISSKMASELREVYPGYFPDNETDLPSILTAVYNKCKNGFIFIIDEWDCIFREAKDNTVLQKKYLDFLRTLLKDRAYVKLAYMTGILPVKKYGTHSALNMFDEFSMTDPAELSEFVGFTEKEVQNLCKKYNKDFKEVQRWYDGYIFEEGMHIYNPKSVVNVMNSRRFKSFWTRTETFEALRIYIDLNIDGLKDCIIAMFGGGRCHVDIENFQNDMTTFDTKDDVLALLIHLGYLGYDSEKTEVFIPNFEIEKEFETSIKRSNWNEVVNSINKSNGLLEATLNLDGAKVAEIIDSVHSDTTSVLKYNDENSLSCVISIAYYSARNDYMLVREFPGGKGFADIVFIPGKNCTRPALVVELKWDQSADGAIDQIKNKNYAGSLAGYFGEVLLVGINYNKENKKHECVIERFQRIPDQ